VSVADAQNCRVLVLNSDNTVASQIGTTRKCIHNPPASMGSPNGDTPLWDGNLLVSEINGSWVSEYTPSGRLIWTVHLRITYPSDPQQLGATATDNSDRYLIADYSRSGKVLQFNREGQVLSTYEATAGPGRLNHPSLAEELPNGIYLINDDDNHRMVAIDPATGALVWQYGVTGHTGAGTGQLNTPDGFDLLGPGGATPTHPQTG
jgi:outer membrane protein assembly factor BamB